MSLFDQSTSPLGSAASSPLQPSESEELLVEKYADQAEATIKEAKRLGRKGIAALICEPFLVVPGLHIIRHNYFERVYTAVKENGGLFIADENQTGLGRIGTHNWAFQKLGFVPDILTIGVSIGNGHPMVCLPIRNNSTFQKFYISLLYFLIHDSNFYSFKGCCGL